MVDYHERHVHVETQTAKINDALRQKQQQLQLAGDGDNTAAE